MISRMKRSSTCNPKSQIITLEFLVLFLTELFSSRRLQTESHLFWFPDIWTWDCPPVTMWKTSLDLMITAVSPTLLVSLRPDPDRFGTKLLGTTGLIRCTERFPSVLTCIWYEARVLSCVSPVLWPFNLLANLLSRRQVSRYLPLLGADAWSCGRCPQVFSTMRVTVHSCHCLFVYAEEVGLVALPEVARR